MKAIMGRIFRCAAITAIAVTFLIPVTRQAALADPHPGQSLNVAFVGDNVIQNGGQLPTAAADFSAFNFFNVNRVNLSLANLNNGTICGGAACDTLVLNVASRFSSGGLNCTTSNLTAAQKVDINAFAAAGGKVIIYDSECTFGGSVDYSWLTHPFNTSNPGALGATGTLVIAEDNILSHSNAANPHYINAASVGSGTDAVGDMNVVDLSTVDPDWCLDLTGINARGTQGATHMYAQSGNGLYIYNGLDVDYLYNAMPVDTSARGYLAKIWLQELQAAADPALLPCLVQVIGISLNPADATNPIRTSHTVTARLADLAGVGTPGVEVTFAVISGPNAGATGTCSANADCTTDANGEVSFTYADTLGPGTDEIQACFIDNSGKQVCSRSVTKTWEDGSGQALCDVDNNGVIDYSDIRAILSSRNSPASGPTDPRDPDRDGVITSLDAKLCISDCTNARCAP